LHNFGIFKQQFRLALQEIAGWKSLAAAQIARLLKEYDDGGFLECSKIVVPLDAGADFFGCVKTAWKKAFSRHAVMKAFEIQGLAMKVPGSNLLGVSRRPFWELFDGKIDGKITPILRTIEASEKVCKSPGTAVSPGTEASNSVDSPIVSEERGNFVDTLSPKEACGAKEILEMTNAQAIKVAPRVVEDTLASMKMLESMEELGGNVAFIKETMVKNLQLIVRGYLAKTNKRLTVRLDHFAELTSLVPHLEMERIQKEEVKESKKRKHREISEDDERFIASLKYQEGAKKDQYRERESQFSREELFTINRAHGWGVKQSANKADLEEKLEELDPQLFKVHYEAKPVQKGPKLQ